MVTAHVRPMRPVQIVLKIVEFVLIDAEMEYADQLKIATIVHRIVALVLTSVGMAGAGRLKHVNHVLPIADRVLVVVTGIAFLQKIVIPVRKIVVHVRWSAGMVYVTLLRAAHHVLLIADCVLMNVEMVCAV